MNTKSTRRSQKQLLKRRQGETPAVAPLPKTPTFIADPDGSVLLYTTKDAVPTKDDAVSAPPIEGANIDGVAAPEPLPTIGALAQAIARGIRGFEEGM